MKIKGMKIKLILSFIGLIIIGAFSINVKASNHEPIRDGLAPGEVRLTKTAKQVEGMVNQWDINLKIEGRNIFPPPDTDIVLVIDNSNSMSKKTGGIFDKSRMEKAKEAAKKFVEQILQDDYNNRIGLITYGTKGKKIADLGGVSQKKELLKIINGIRANGGGTHTQEGIKLGMEQLESQAEASRRLLVLISDGVPTYSYSVKAPYNTKEYMTEDTGNDRYVTSENIPESGFNYPVGSTTNRLGNGSNMFLRFGGLFSKNYYSMGNHAISESNIWKDKKKNNGDQVVTDVYTIGVDMTESDEEQLVGQVNVLYQDEEKKELATRKYSGEVDVDTYKTEKLDFDGYTLKSIEGPTEGIFSENLIEVTYNYAKDSSRLNDTETQETTELADEKNNPTINKDSMFDTDLVDNKEKLSPVSFTEKNIRSDNVPENGIEVLKKIASKPSMCYSATGDSLDKILKQIGDEILSAVKDGYVNDPMGDGFELTKGAKNIKVSQGSYQIDSSNTPNKIDWEVGTLTVPVSDDPEEDIMFAEMSYRIDANQSVLDDGVMTDDGFAKTNGETIFNYIDFNSKKVIKNFDVPSVKPTIVSLQKKLYDRNGNIVTSSKEEFKFSLEEEDYGQGDYILNPEQIVKIVHPWKASKEYKIEEILTSEQKYNVVITINDIAYENIFANMKFEKDVNKQYYENQTIIVSNKMNLVSKKRYVYIRQCVINLNEDLVIPSKGFYKGEFENVPDSMMSLTSGSTINNETTNVTDKLFTKYQISKVYDTSDILKITNNIPEYYEQVGFIVTKEKDEIEKRHISKNKKEFISSNLAATLDFSETNENWITIFIEPNFGNEVKNISSKISPKPYSWDYVTNKFGK